MSQILKLVKRITPFTSISATEKWNTEKLIKMLYSDKILIDTLDWNERAQMEKILRCHFIKIKNIRPFTKQFLIHVYHNRFQLLKEEIKVKYIYNKKRPLGRVYPVDSLGLCQARREIRHTLSDGIYVDIDMVNAHPVILNQLFKCSYTMLNDYVNDRDKYFGLLCDHYATFGKVIDYKTPEGRELCKGFFIIPLLYFGSYNNWAEDNNLGILETFQHHELFTAYPPPPFFNGFKEEMLEISNKLISENELFAKEIEINKEEEKKHENTKGSVVSWFCQEWERRILEVIYDVLKKEKLIKKENVVLCFDGLMILLTELFDTEEKQQLILRYCEVEVFKRLELNIQLKVKAFDEPINAELLNFDIPEANEIDDEEDFSDNEQEIVGNAKEMLDFYKNHFEVDGFFRRSRLGISELVNKLFPKHFIYHFKEWYGWNSKKNKWEKSKIPLNLCIMYDIRDYLTKALNGFKINKKEYKGAIGEKFKLLEEETQTLIEKILCNPVEVDFLVKVQKI
jgi:hypothetical protein